jgi:hypothetical protein
MGIYFLHVVWTEVCPLKYFSNFSTTVIIFDRQTLREVAFAPLEMPRCPNRYQISNRASGMNAPCEILLTGFARKVIVDIPYCFLNINQINFSSLSISYLYLALFERALAKGDAERYPD